MTRKDWLCPVCGNVMIQVHPCSSSMCCFITPAHSKCRPLWRLHDLPHATRISNRDYLIPRQRGVLIWSARYQYVPRGHETALDKAPTEGHVVASVTFRGGRAVRLFKKKGA